MVFDDIIIGAGLTALATALGLPTRRRVLVLTGGAGHSTQTYDTTSATPCSHLGLGGLGNFWHGVIPMHTASYLPATARQQLPQLLEHFYPGESAAQRHEQPWLFVPYRPIRPGQHWQRLQVQRGDKLVLEPLAAQQLVRAGDQWQVQTPAGQRTGKRIWLAAGALGTPSLLERSFVGTQAVRATASDHVILYLGQVERPTEHPDLQPQVHRSRHGVWMQTHADSDSDGLITIKPARFSYRTLDEGIQQRSAFGLPTSGLLSKLLRAGSLGLLAESLYNKLGLFPDASTLSVYAQVRLSDIYQRNPNSGGVTVDTERMAEGIRVARTRLQHPWLRPSQRPELYVRGIHLHDTVRPEHLNSPGLTVVDASAVTDIGHAHHSFRLMANAYHRASTSEST